MEEGERECYIIIQLKWCFHSIFVQDNTSAVNQRSFYLFIFPLFCFSFFLSFFLFLILFLLFYFCDSDFLYQNLHIVAIFFSSILYYNQLVSPKTCFTLLLPFLIMLEKL